MQIQTPEETSLELQEKNGASIKAAGGLLWRRTLDGREIAIIHRERYDDWTLPKGKLNEGETWQQAALREVQEETGWQAIITGFAGAISYPTHSGLKVVRFYHMTPTKESALPLDDEVSEVYWLSLDEARQRLQYPLEQALLEALQDSDPNLFLTASDNEPPAEKKSRPESNTSLPNLLETASAPKTTQRSRFSDLFGSPSSRRLNHTLALVAVELEDSSEKLSPSQSKAARQLLLLASQLSEQGQVEAGWKLIKASRRYLIYTLDPLQLTDRANMILSEAVDEGKGVSKWRQKSIHDLLSVPDDSLPKPPPLTADRVIQAEKLLDEHQDNVYQRLSILRTRLAFLTGIGLLWLVAWFVLLGQYPLTGLIADTASPFSGLASTPLLFWLIIALAGVLGSLISSFTSSIGSDPKKTRIPTQLSTNIITYSRMMVAALSAIAVTLFLTSGIISLGELNLPLIIAFAIVSGFSDRLLMGALEKVGK